MRILRFSPIVALFVCSISATGLSISTSQVFAQEAGKPVGKPNVGRGQGDETNDKAQRERAIALIKEAVEKSKGSPELKRAVESKDGSRVASILMQNGAPEGIVATVGAGGAAGPQETHIHVHCECDGWGPIDIDIDI
jgi:hypothetical protein